MSEEIEIWRNVVDWPKYQVSNMGSVRGSRGPIKPFFVIGYPAFNVVDGRSKRKSLRVHREMMKSFFGDNPDLLVRHLDGNPKNCILSNLAWGTFKDNENDKKIHGRRMFGESHHQCKLTKEMVKDIRNSNLSGVELAKMHNVTPSAICAIRKGRTWNTV